ncbi:MAG: NTP transferase domain-containing protein, partial [Pseudomonadota bacterium]
MPEITGLLLAAGNSSRFGDHKLLVELEGRPLILRSIDCLRECDRILAVVRAGDAPLQQCLRSAGVETVINPQADQGMGR